MQARLVLLCLLPLALAACVAPPRSLEPAPVPAAVDHGLWDTLLARHVADGVVDYPALCAEPSLDRYLAQLAAAPDDPAVPEAERLVLLLNGYNALVVASVCEGRAPSTLLGRYEFFWRERLAIAGEAITLWDLEHERIRPLGEPRIHFALVCASSSCPRLRAEAYAVERLDAQLEADTRGFVNDPTRNRFDAAENEAFISAIFEWYEEDFLAVAPSVPAYIARYVDDPDVARLLTDGEARVHTLPYDWSPNGPLPGDQP